MEAKSMRAELSATQDRCLDEMVEAELIIRGVMMTGATEDKKITASHPEGNKDIRSERMRVESELLCPKGAIMAR